MKQVVANYTFDTVAKTVTLTDYTTVHADRLALITDITTGKILFNFADSAVTVTAATNVFTLSALQGGEANTDKLRIDYDALAADPQVNDTVSAVQSGTWTVAGGANVFHVDDNAASLTVDGTVAVSSGPAAARTTDSISAALATDAIMNGTTVLAPAFTPISSSTSGASTVVAAVASKKIRILGLFLVCSSAVTVAFQSHTTTATATGTMSFAANGGISIPFSPVGWFETVAGEALDINLGGAVQTSGMVVYVAV